jgi:hypothetical protein
MAKAFYSNSVLMTIILFLSILLLFNILYGCRAPTKIEGFEDVVMNAEEEKPKEEEEEKEDKTMEQLQTEIAPILDEKSLKELVSKVKDTAITMLPPKDIVVDKKTSEVLSKKETELFEAISNNKITNDDLEKLVKAGVVTEKMIERFLAKMDDENKETTTEEDAEALVVEGFSCGRDYATF